MQLSCHRVRAELMKRCCLGVFSQLFQRYLGVWVFSVRYSPEHDSPWTPRYVGLGEIQIKLPVSIFASAESLWLSLWHRACHKLIYFDIWLEHYAAPLSKRRKEENFMCVPYQGWIVSHLKICSHRIMLSAGINNVLSFFSAKCMLIHIAICIIDIFVIHIHIYFIYL